MNDVDRRKWEEGVAIEGGVTAPAEVRILRHEAGKTWLELTIVEGRNQQVRRMGEATGFPVMRLSRTSFGGITSEGLRPGGYRSLTLDELREIREVYGVPRRLPRAPEMSAGQATSPRKRQKPPRAPEMSAGQATSRRKRQKLPRAPEMSAGQATSQRKRQVRGGGLTARRQDSRRKVGG
jgi:23S rRNA pseudouridine2605 synthase